ncbi:hypothetical protein [Blastococcus haudaquaticus]|uniref:Excreted virulence factor EspC, type VII ESX diderm n=1 Tax=Blastococcus haudaquaticus TaxID=1938745 RepID=A0A286GF88_9ACTN|nr:hypothetical protein [Blastococcus haudaquaticus]SOD94193.1 hypothetical protein SAMN06272739_0633 [Blastococcus haudaquaticus]
MSIEMPTVEVHALAGSLRDVAAEAAQIAPRLDRPGDVGAALQAGVEAFLDVQRMVGQALAGELEWLAGTVAAVADSWVDLDRALLDPDRGTRAR